MKLLLLAVAILASLPTFAGNYARIYLQDGKYRITKPGKDAAGKAITLKVSAPKVALDPLTGDYDVVLVTNPTTGMHEPVMVSEWASLREAHEAAAYLPLGPRYRVTMPDAYIDLSECLAKGKDRCKNIYDLRLMP